MKQAQASALFRSECDRFPLHPQHVHAQMLTQLHLVRVHGANRVKRHSRLIAAVLARMDGAYA